MEGKRNSPGCRILNFRSSILYPQFSVFRIEDRMAVLIGRTRSAAGMEAAVDRSRLVSCLQPAV
jgi:hypothetical protein